MRSLSVKKLQAGQRIRVLVVDDSVVIRRLVTNVLEQDPALEVVGSAAHGGIALARIPQLNPDVLTLDIEMPEMDGLEALKHLRRGFPGIRVVMFNTLTERGAAATLEALSLGADDYVTKASNAGSLDQSMLRLRNELIPKIKQFFAVPDTVTSGVASPSAAAPVRAVTTFTGGGTLPQVVGIGVSTGGPAALGQILPQFPADFPLPILIVQHMPALFTQMLAERLNGACSLTVQEAREGDRVEAGKVLIAPGDFHMRVVRTQDGVRIKLDQSAPQNSCRPAVDALFASLAEAYRGAIATAILTGMGQDGLRGAGLVKANGGTVIAQDEASSVVWGMPGAVVKAGLAHAVVPLHQMTETIVRTASATSTATAAGIKCQS